MHISSLQQFLSLTREEAQRNLPVRFTAGVTYYDPSWHILFVQDGMTGYWIYGSEVKETIELGDLVEVTATTILSSGYSNLHQPKVRRIKPGTLPGAQRISAKGLREHYSQRVSFEATVRSVMVSEGRLCMQLEEDGAWINAYVPSIRQGDDGHGLVDARVRLTGVSAYESQQHPSVVGRIYCPGMSDIEVLVPQRGNPLEIPVTSIRKLLTSAGQSPSTRVHVQGEVSDARLGEQITITDTTGSILLRCMSIPTMGTNRHVEAWGFVHYLDGRLVLDHALLSPMAGTRMEKQHTTGDSGLAMQANRRCLENIKEIQQLGKLEADQALPVRLKAIVTHVDKGVTTVFVHDGSGGMCVLLPQGATNIWIGQELEIEGTTVSGDILPMVAASRCSVLGKRAWPEAQRVSLSELMDCSHDCDIVEMEGVITRAETAPDDAVLTVLHRDGLFRVVVGQGSTDPSMSLVGRQVMVQGVCSADLTADARKVLNIRLHVPSLEPPFFKLLGALPVDAASLPPVPIDNLVYYDAPLKVGSQRIKVMGVVSLSTGQNELYVQNDHAGIKVRMMQSRRVAVGAEVEVLGFLSHEKTTPVLIESDVKVLKVASKIEPVVVPQLDKIVYSSVYESRLIKVKGRLIEPVFDMEAPQFMLENENVHFTASFAAGGRMGVSQWPVGTLLELTGICQLQSGIGRKPNGFHLLMRTPEDVRLLKLPSWLTREGVFWALIGSVAVVGGSMLWIYLLRERVREQTALVRHQLEQEASLERRYKELWENANDLFFTLDLRGHCTAVNAATAQLFGVSHSAMVGRAFGDFAGPQNGVVIEGVIQELVRGQRPVSRELRVTHSGGKTADLDVLFRPMRHGGDLDAIQAIARDVTEQKHMHESLARERNLLRTLIDHLPDYIYIKDVTGQYLLSNDATLRLKGLASTREVVGKTAFDVFPSSYANAFHTDDLKVLREGVSMYDREEPSVDVQGKTRWLCTTKVPLKDAQGRVIGLVGISRDVTERRNLEMQLRQSQKMDSVGQLAAGVAHDFNNLLTVIQGNVGLLQTEKQLCADTQAALQEISNAAQRAANLTRQLLMFSRKQVMQPKTLDVNELITNLTKMLHRLLGEHVELDTQYADRAAMIHGDVGMIEQVIVNLCVNARDAMPNGGKLLIQSDVVDIDQAYAKARPEARPGRYVRVSVQDTGHGMDDATLARIFEPFFTTKPSGKGTGLGLATVYGIVKQHQGWVEVQSMLHKGTTFGVYIPLDARDVVKPQDSPENAGATQGHETILVVEDEAPLRLLVTRILSRQGYRVVAAKSGVEALDLWAVHKHEVDLLLTDMVMPNGVSGKQLAATLLAERPELRVIYSSGYSMDLAAQGGQFKTDVNFLPKPYPTSKLVEIVRRNLDHSVTV